MNVKTMNVKALATATVCSALLWGWAALFAPVALASYSECPAAGSTTSCDGQITVGPGGSLSLSIDPLQRPVDGFDDTSIGILNHSGKSLRSLTLDFGGKTQIFANRSNTDGAFDFGFNGYNGPDTTFTKLNRHGTRGTIDFTRPLANGAATYFEVEAGPSAFGDGGTIGNTPEPSTLVLLSTGLLCCLFLARKRSGIFTR